MTTNIIPFQQSADIPVTSTNEFEGFQLGKKQITSNGITYSFEQELRASVSPGAIINYFQSLVEYNLLIPQNTHGFAYFQELLHILSYAGYKLEGNNIFLLPETTLHYIHRQVGELNIFECKSIMVQIDRILAGLEFTSQLKSSYNYIRSVVFTRFEELRKSNKER